MNNRIFRVETVEGKGIYRGPDWDGVDESGSDSSKHPMPHKDSKLLDENKDLFYHIGDGEYRFLDYDFIFGFSSIDQLRRWLYNDEWLSGLDRQGFVLSIYEGDVRHGHTQAVINKDTAVLVAQHKISDYFKL